jgi:hypothetical protein
MTTTMVWPSKTFILQDTQPWDHTHFSFCRQIISPWLSCKQRRRFCLRTTFRHHNGFFDLRSSHLHDFSPTSEQDTE